MSAVTPDYKALVKDALTKINTLKSRLREVEAERHAPIAIVSYGCRLPGGIQDEAGLSAMLHSQQDRISATARERFNLDPIFDAQQRRPGKTYARALGLLSGYESFDQAFFGISEQEAERLDPQQRLLMETSWEAFERGGIVPDQLAGSRTGVYVGISTQEFAQAASLQRTPVEFTAHDGPGSSLAVAAGRLSYFYGLHGPALAIDTACSSVLVCVHEAVQALRARQIDTALAGGVNLIINPLMMLVFAQAGVLSSSGQQRCFDASGDGYVRAEACTLLVLKRLQDALDEGLPVLGVIRGSAVNHGGRSQGITAPSETGQQAVMQAALQDAGLTPDQVDCVEAHATGTALGDFIELSALHEVYGQARTRPLWLGSVKSRVGHAETGSAGPALLAILQQLRAGKLAGQLHYSAPNALFDWSNSRLQVAATPMSWPGEGVAAVSAFGYNGTNAHLILSSLPSSSLQVSREGGDRHPWPLPGLKISARSQTALRELLAAWQQYLQGIGETTLPLALAKANGGRSDFEFRLWIPGKDLPSLQAAITRILASDALPERPVRSRRREPLPPLPLNDRQVDALVNAWLMGADIAWRTYYPALSDIDIPTYRFQRQRFWLKASHASVQRVQLQHLSQTHFFLGQTFDAPEGSRYHGCLADNHPTMAGFRLFGVDSLSPMWPVVATCAALPVNLWSMSRVAWGQASWSDWPRYAQDARYPLHTCVEGDEIVMQWRETTNSTWHRLFACHYAARPATVIPLSLSGSHPLQSEKPAALDSQALSSRWLAGTHSDTHVSAHIDTSLAQDMLGPWFDADEVHSSMQWMTALEVIDAAFHACQRWSRPGEALLPASCDQLIIDVPALVAAFASGQALQSHFIRGEEIHQAIQVNWQICNAGNQVLLSAEGLVLYHVNAKDFVTADTPRITARPRMPSVDLAPLRALLTAVQGRAVQDRNDVESRLLDLLVLQLETLTGASVSPGMSLLALGVDSLWAMDFRARLQTELGLVLPLAFLMRGPSLAEVVAHLAAQMQDLAPVAEKLASAIVETADEEEMMF